MSYEKQVQYYDERDDVIETRQDVNGTFQPQYEQQAQYQQGQYQQRRYSNRSSYSQDVVDEHLNKVGLYNAIRQNFIGIGLFACLLVFAFSAYHTFFQNPHTVNQNSAVVAEQQANEQGGLQLVESGSHFTKLPAEYDVTTSSGKEVKCLVFTTKNGETVACDWGDELNSANGSNSMKKQKAKITQAAFSLDKPKKYEAVTQTQYDVSLASGKEIECTLHTINDYYHKDNVTCNWGVDLRKNDFRQTEKKSTLSQTAL